MIGVKCLWCVTLCNNECNVSKKSMAKEMLTNDRDIHKNHNHHHIIKQSFVKLNKAYDNWAPAYHIITTVMRKTFPSIHLFFRILFYLNGSDAMTCYDVYKYNCNNDYFIYETVYSQQSFSFRITVNVKGKTNFLFSNSNEEDAGVYILVILAVLALHTHSTVN